jgi:hypothetical protein
VEFAGISDKHAGKNCRKKEKPRDWCVIKGLASSRRTWKENKVPNFVPNSLVLESP